MIKRLFSTMQIMFKYARTVTIIKLALMIILAFLVPLNLILLQNLIDAISLGNIENAYLWTAIFIIAMLSISILSSIGQALNIRLRRKLYENFTDTLLCKFKNIKYQYFEDQEYHNTLHKMGNAPQEKIYGIFINFTELLSCGFSLFGVISIFIQVNLWIPVAFIILIFPIIYLECKSMDLYYQLDNVISDDLRKMWYLANLLTDKKSLYELKVFKAIDYILNKWNLFAKAVLRQRVSTTKKARNYHFISSLICIIWAIIVTLFLCNRLFGNNISYGLFVSLVGAISTVIGLTNAISSQTSNITKNHLDIQHYHTFLQLPEIDKSLQNKTFKDHTICFDNVYFRYPNTDTDILKGVSFNIQAGEKVALVGKNGQGKSTIIKLLCGLFAPDTGKITIGGVDLKDIPNQQLCEIFSIIFQDYQNYWLTLRENIVLGDIEQLHNDDTILEAMRKGGAEKILALMPKGLDTSLGKLVEDGVDLSGGQWQRIALSRALLSNTPFIILDEPTAALDPVAESEMYESFTKIINEKGCLLISHRLGSAKIADRIIVIENGVIHETGTHKELIDKNGLYAKMFISQQSWYQADKDWKSGMSGKEDSLR